MKKLLLLSAMGLLAATLAAGPGPAMARKARQVVEGTVHVPTAAPGNLENCWTSLHATAMSISAETQGVLGYYFKVDKNTFKKRFVLEVVAQVGVADLDIVFFKRPFNLTDETLGELEAFQSRRPGGEKGRVPKGHEHAFVCMYGGGRENHATQVSFVYSAG